MTQSNCRQSCFEDISKHNTCQNVIPGSKSSWWLTANPGERDSGSCAGVRNCESGTSFGGGGVPCDGLCARSPDHQFLKLTIAIADLNGLGQRALNAIVIDIIHDIRGIIQN